MHAEGVPRRQASIIGRERLRSELLVFTAMLADSPLDPRILAAVLHVSAISFFAISCNLQVNGWPSHRLKF